MSAALSVECPYCGAVLGEPCRNQRKSSQTTYGTGSRIVAVPSRVWTKRPHAERSALAARKDRA